MCPACCGPEPHSSRRRAHWRHAERALAVGLLLALTACASDRSAQYQPAHGDSAPAYSAEARPPRVQTESDGLPAQPPPPLRSAAVVDDPREPWSRNYGTVAPTRMADASASAPTVPEPVKIVAAVRPTLTSLFQPKPIDADAIVRRAIAEHEMRKGD